MTPPRDLIHAGMTTQEVVNAIASRDAEWQTLVTRLEEALRESAQRFHAEYCESDWDTCGSHECKRARRAMEP